MSDDLDDIRDEEGMEESIYPVKCVCGFIGMSDDCRRNECPNCGLRIMRGEYEYEGSNGTDTAQS